MEIEMKKMNWQEFNDRKDEAVVILPIGSLEQHGPHLPLSTDTIISYNLALLLAKEANGIVAPPINYGYKSLPTSGGGPLFPGTIDLNGITLMGLIEDIVKEFIIDGVKKIMIINSHYENEAFILEAVDNITRKLQTDAKVIIASWWDQISDDTVNEIFDEVKFPGWALEHAAITETSLILNFAPELVHMERLVEEGINNPPTYSTYPIPDGIVPPSGLLATARTSSKEKGELMTKEVIEKFKKIVKEAFD